MGFSPGEESLAAAIAAQAIEAQPFFGQIKPERGRVVRAPDSILGRRSGGRRVSREVARELKVKKSNRDTWREPHHSLTIGEDGLVTARTYCHRTAGNWDP
jgi:hypothetical protein